MKKFFLLLLILVVFLSHKMLAINTRVTVRALGKDSKFIGSSVGGAEVTIRNVKTKEVLASGITSGSTGSTNLLVKKARIRYEQRADMKSAKFSAVIDLKEPTLVQITARGPMALGSPQEVSVTQWLFPEKHLDSGDGIILELPGFAIWPRPLDGKAKINQPITLRATIKMMCGCPLSPDGLWDSSAMDLWAVVKHRGKVVHKASLNFIKDSQFSLSFTPRKQGTFEVIFMAFDARTANTGIGKLYFEAEGKVPVSNSEI